MCRLDSKLSELLTLAPVSMLINDGHARLNVVCECLAASLP